MGLRKSIKISLIPIIYSTFDIHCYDMNVSKAERLEYLMQKDIEEIGTGGKLLHYTKKELRTSFKELYCDCDLRIDKEGKFLNQTTRCKWLGYKSAFVKLGLLVGATNENNK